MHDSRPGNSNRLIGIPLDKLTAGQGARMAAHLPNILCDSRNLQRRTAPLAVNLHKFWVLTELTFNLSPSAASRRANPSATNWGDLPCLVKAEKARRSSR